MSDSSSEIIEVAQRIAANGDPGDAEFFAEPGSAEAKLYMQRHLIEGAAKILGISVSEALDNSIEVESKHIYVWSADREGAVFMDGETGKHLYAPASIEFADHLESFQRGIRS